MFLFSVEAYLYRFDYRHNDFYEGEYDYLCVLPWEPVQLCIFLSVFSWDLMKDISREREVL